MNLPEMLGWMAAALMVATFASREARRMRALAVTTNLAFIGYGIAAALMPVLALHLLLLPINAWRLAQLLGPQRHPGHGRCRDCGRTTLRSTSIGHAHAPR